MAAVSALRSTVKNGFKKYRSLLAGNSPYFPPAYELISTTVLSTATKTVTFTNIPQNYKHLQIRWTSKGAPSNLDTLIATVNSDATASYVTHKLVGNGTSVTSSTYQSELFMRISDVSGVTANSFAGGVTDILDYASSVKNKTFRTL